MGVAEDKKSGSGAARASRITNEDTVTSLGGLGSVDLETTFDTHAGGEVAKASKGSTFASLSSQGNAAER